MMYLVHVAALEDASTVFYLQLIWASQWTLVVSLVGNFSRETKNISILPHRSDYKGANSNAHQSSAL